LPGGHRRRPSAKIRSSVRLGGPQDGGLQIVWEAYSDLLSQRIGK
jgi:hypothetical protein